jgi:hypothetical protein
MKNTVEKETLMVDHMISKVIQVPWKGKVIFVFVGATHLMSIVTTIRSARNLEHRGGRAHSQKSTQTSQNLSKRDQGCHRN